MTDSSSAGVASQSKRSLARRFLWNTFRLVGVVYALVLGALVLFEARLVYPGAYMGLHDAEQDPDAEDLEYEAEDGTRLLGRLLQRTNPERIILYYHGNGVRVQELDQRLRHLSETYRATVMLAEFRGFQPDTGTPTEEKVISDALAAHEALCVQLEIEPAELVLFGRSLGGGVAVAVAEQKGCHSLVLDRTFDRIVDVAAEKYPLFPIKLLMQNRFDSVARISKYTGPVIQIHGDQDRLISIEHARRLHEACPSQLKSFVEVPAIGHNGRLPVETEEKILAYMQGAS